MLKNKNILIGITGGIAAYKICELVRMFKRSGANVKTVVTKNALEFVTKLTLDTLSCERVYTEQFNTDDRKPEHIALCGWADVFLIAPATANTLGKLANGVCDNLLSSLACAFQGQPETKGALFLAPAMNTGMWNNPAVQRNIQNLRENGAIIIDPESGFLACGTSGEGRLADLEKVFGAVENFFTKKQFLSGKKVVITAGGTRENLDPVRFLGNYSSGKMGTAIADAAQDAGAEVVLIKTFPLSRAYKTVDTTTAEEMLEAVRNAFKDADILIMTAAVADYRPENSAPLKIKKEDTEEIVLKLVKNPDILTEMCKAKKPNQQILGFCAETDNLIENAKEKIQRKNCDFLAANDVSNKEIGFSSDKNEIYLIDKNLNVTKLEKDTKENIAKRLLETIWQEQAK